ncbi:hypothetical protein JQ615_28180 [Bradyrhizobium jicamae]|uniref:Transposase DDE domain-containing protein n=1 Tax=Bradyrhizobium jicamae TaxID=280332 RepID=A0ABS5FR65_9BRAD|nr:hypothetical protein [Bradyrhizobium jicamae]MBR0799274.1 hypothetical protein [Bradyrhizobium jicamae]
MARAAVDHLKQWNFRQGRNSRREPGELIYCVLLQVPQLRLRATVLAGAKLCSRESANCAAAAHRCPITTQLNNSCGLATVDCWPTAGLMI